MSHFTTVPVNELEAVNMLLAAVGEAAVSNLETATTVDVTQAKNLLSNINREVQQKGWHFNTEEHVKVEPDSNKNITLQLLIIYLLLINLNHNLAAFFVDDYKSLCYHQN